MDFSWLDEFATLIQLISAINFAYIFTHFIKKVYTKIFNEEEIINNKFSSYKEGPIERCKISINNMNSIVINGINTQEHKEQLKRELEKLTKQWDRAKNKSKKIIENVKEVKGLKCLFLFISGYCIIDLFNIALVNILPNYNFILIFVFSINVVSLIFSIILTYWIIKYKWKKKTDIYCYNETKNYFFYTIIISVIITIINELLVFIFGVAFSLSSCFTIIMLLPCVFLPIYPCVFSFFYIYFIILWLNNYRKKNQDIIDEGLKKIDFEKKKKEDAVSTLTRGLHFS